MELSKIYIGIEDVFQKKSMFLKKENHLAGRRRRARTRLKSLMKVGIRIFQRKKLTEATTRGVL